MTLKVDNPEAPTLPGYPQSNMKVWSRRLTTLAPLWTLLALFLFFSLSSETFRRPININNILVQSATLGILAAGTTFVLLTGEIDLSIAAVMGLSSMISAQLYVNLGYPEPIPTLVAL